MENYQILVAIGAAITGLMLALSIYDTFKKFRTRNNFVERMAHDRAVIAAIEKYKEKHLENSKEHAHYVSLLENLIAERALSLARAERELIEGPLHQPSPIGRARYVERMAHDIEMHHAPSMQ